MHQPTLLLTALAATPVISKTVHSVLVFSRHGDRTSKVFPGYQMTNLGATQCFNSGTYYRNLYIADNAPSQIAGISSSEAVHSQLWASAPDQSVLFQTAQNFLQGLYPPLGQEEEGVETLTDGTTVIGPLDGYQYIHIHGEADNAPDTIWLKGDDACPAWNRASRSYRQSAEYNATFESSREFYANFEDLLEPILGQGNVTYAKAYDVFDLLNTGRSQNESVVDRVSEEDVATAKFLADEWEWNMNYNATQPSRSIGGETLLGGILRQIAAVVEDEASTTKFSLMTGSYDTFLAFFGITDLPAQNADFYGLPEYASTMAFEIFSDGDDAPFPSADVDEEVFVRFTFRNGTEEGSEAVAYPLGGIDVSANGGMRYGDFKRGLESKAVLEVGDWCARCGSVAEFCVAANQTVAEGAQTAASGGNGGLSNAAAGGIGAGVTLAVVAVLGLVAWLFTRKRRTAAAPSPGAAEKRLSHSGSEGETV